MTQTQPMTHLDRRYSSPDAEPTAWADAFGLLEGAPVFWLSTVRPDGRPHVTPLICVLLDGSLYFCTGPGERKAQNLAHNRHVVLTTGANTFDHGLDLTVEGDAARVTDDEVLRRISDAYEAKYGSEWHFDVADGAFRHPDRGQALVFEVAPSTAHGFAKDPFSQTRWCFGPRDAT